MKINKCECRGSECIIIIIIIIIKIRKDESVFSDIRNLWCSKVILGKKWLSNSEFKANKKELTKF